MSAKQNGNAALSDEARAKAFASMTPIEQLLYEQQERMLAATLERNALASAEQRARVSAEQKGFETHRVAEERHVEVARGRRAWSAPVTTPLELVNVQGSPTVPCTVRLGGQRYGSDEGERAGKHGISTCVVVDSAEAERLLLEDCWRPHLDARAELERVGDVEGLAALTKTVTGRRTVESFEFRRWREITQILLKRCVRQGGTLEQLLAAGTVKLADADGIAVDETALRTSVEAR